MFALDDNQRRIQCECRWFCLCALHCSCLDQEHGHDHYIFYDQTNLYTHNVTSTTMSLVARTILAVVSTPLLTVLLLLHNNDSNSVDRDLPAHSLQWPACSTNGTTIPMPSMRAPGRHSRQQKERSNMHQLCRQGKIAERQCTSSHARSEMCRMLHDVTPCCHDVALTLISTGRERHGTKTPNQEKIQP